MAIFILSPTVFLNLRQNYRLYSDQKPNTSNHIGHSIHFGYTLPFVKHELSGMCHEWPSIPISENSCPISFAESAISWEFMFYLVETHRKGRGRNRVAKLWKSVPTGQCRYCPCGKSCGYAGGCSKCLRPIRWPFFLAVASPLLYVARCA